MKGIFRRYSYLFFSVVFFFAILFVIATGNHRMSVVTYNVNKLKSIQAIRMQNQYSLFLSSKVVATTPVIYDSFSDAIATAQSGQEASFNGKLTGYGPDCKGCGGAGACSPRQDFRNGNIYFNDATYGKIRIVAADRSLPCGSIVRIHNIKIYSEPILAIVMDRGGAIKGKHLDLLFETEKNLQGFSTQMVQFDIVRLGF